MQETTRDVTNTDSCPEHYTAETTTSIDRVEVARKGGGDGVYKNDYDDESTDISREIAQIVIDAGGRVPADRSFEYVENDGVGRQRTYILYVPSAERFHVAADLKDLLTETDSVESETIEIGGVAKETGERDFSVELNRSTTGNTQGQIENAIEELRWFGGVDRDERTQDALKTLDVEDERERELQKISWRLRNHAGDAWELQKVRVYVFESADQPHFG